MAKATAQRRLEKLPAAQRKKHQRKNTMDTTPKRSFSEGKNDRTQRHARQKARDVGIETGKRAPPPPPPPVGDRDHVGLALKYARDVVAGRVNVCKEVRQACARHLNDLERAKRDDFPYEFNARRGGRAARYIELLPHVKGPLAKAKKAIVLEPWQCFAIVVPFGWVRKDNKRRRFRRVYIEVPRKNAKSTLSSAIALYMLAGDGEEGAEVYSAATTKDQAKIVWGDAQKMLNKAPHGTRVRDRLGITAPTAPTASSIFRLATNSVFKPLSRESDNLDGLNISGAVVDELHAHKTREIYDVIDTGTGAREQPLIWIITTAGTDTSGICYEIRQYVRKILEGTFTDETWFGLVYTIDESDDWMDGECRSKCTDHTHEGCVWRKANPNWGISVDPEDFTSKATKAMQPGQTAAQSNFKTKHLCVWCNAESPWMDMGMWDKCADATMKMEDFREDMLWDALDLATKIDITCKGSIFRRDLPHRDPEELAKGKTEAHYYGFVTNWLPQGTVERGVNDSYEGWVTEGYIVATPGEVIDYDGTVKPAVIADRNAYNLRECCYDPWQATQLAGQLSDEAIEMVEFRQTTANMSAPMKELQAAVYDGRFHHTGDPCLRWQVSNVVCHLDAKDNVYPNKERPENKIDGPVSLIMAMGRAMFGAPPPNIRGL